MARAYDDDLRRKIFAAHARGQGSFRTLAAVFGVSLGYVEKIFRQRKRTGREERVRHRPGPRSRVTNEVREWIVARVGAQPDLTMEELRQELAAGSGVEMSCSLLRMWVGRLGLRRKKSRSTLPSGTRKPTANGVKRSSKPSAASRRRG